jgi:hypothetical protein
VNAVLYLFTGLSAIGGASGVASFFLWKANSKKLNAEGKKLDIEGDALMSEKALEMYEAMSVRAKAAESKAEAADLKASRCIEGTYELIDHIYMLRRLMAEHKIEPPPFRFPSSITGVGVH